VNKGFFAYYVIYNVIHYNAISTFNVVLLQWYFGPSYFTHNRGLLSNFLFLWLLLSCITKFYVTPQSMYSEAGTISALSHEQVLQKLLTHGLINTCCIRQTWNCTVVQLVCQRTESITALYFFLFSLFCYYWFFYADIHKHK